MHFTFSRLNMVFLFSNKKGYVLMSKHQTVTQACIDAIYRASEPVAPGFTVHKATYNGCDINNL